MEPEESVFVVIRRLQDRAKQYGLANETELEGLLEHYEFLRAVYGTAVMFHDLDDQCDCETCVEAEGIRQRYDVPAV